MTSRPSRASDSTPPRHPTRTRTTRAGALRASDAGTEQVLTGWVHRRRDLGGVYFVDLRDAAGLAQVSVGPDWTGEESLALVRELGPEDVIRVEGRVELRPDEARNPEMATGDVELRAVRIQRLNRARTPEIPVYLAPEETLPSEKLRLRHRNLDLRRAELQQNLRLRHELVLAVRNHFAELGFMEVETPILTKPTPEGARDYLVPSRVHPGEFYALPQSPQLYKQILMTSGFDRYMQIARCFRDEDLRADRQPEFTQIDVEAAFIEADDLMEWIEGLMETLAGVAGVGAEAPFQRMTWADAMDRYGSDRPDLRWSLELEDWSEALADTDGRILTGALEAGGRIRGLRLEGGARLSRRQVEEVEAEAKAAGAPGLLWAKRTEDGGSGPLSRWMEERHWDAVGAVPGDLLLAAAGPDRMTSPALSAARTAAIRVLELPKEEEDAWLWVLDFPLFEEEDGEVWANHHPFVLPHPDDADRLDDDPLSVRGLAYDLVYNGSELGSGSLRCHDPALQRRILRILGLEDEEIDRKFGFLLEALGSGAPPHGGIALGLDRIVKDFLGVQSLRDVIAFPKTTAARALFEEAPVAVPRADLEALGIEVSRTAAPYPEASAAGSGHGAGEGRPTPGGA
ncbi:MAG: aspartate--tRNA ligase [Gemmatimonadales bacterium]|nr:MAG: aspartate--tRNA ligase [Gemmatimonadales bacterium]